MNWRVMYPVTIQDDDLKRAFLSMSGVQDLIAKIVDSVYKAAEYDEFLLFKYLLIKGVSSGKMTPVSVDAAKPDDAAKNSAGCQINLRSCPAIITQLGLKPLRRAKIRQFSWMQCLMRNMM